MFTAVRPVRSSISASNSPGPGESSPLDPRVSLPTSRWLLGMVNPATLRDPSLPRPPDVPSSSGQCSPGPGVSPPRIKWSSAPPNEACDVEGNWNPFFCPDDKSPSPESPSRQNSPGPGDASVPFLIPSKTPPGASRLVPLPISTPPRYRQRRASTINLASPSSSNSPGPGVGSRARDPSKTPPGAARVVPLSMLTPVLDRVAFNFSTEAVTSGSYSPGAGPAREARKFWSRDGGSFHFTPPSLRKALPAVSYAPGAGAFSVSFFCRTDSTYRRAMVCAGTLVSVNRRVPEVRTS
mmetsp:Transcript_12485/g.46636  ORF Transcript_12485/g.46636 Transcript_12485/m.46636 type:complete len:295 (-) Transcript_12485:3454-4338(-)